MRVQFWGVRGSVPWATPGSIGHGCNTPCVEVLDEPTGRRLILDAGSGIVGIGEALGAVANIPIVLTHYHWDHVQGLPFFAPLYRPGTAVTVWAPALGRQFADIETMFESPFFPVPVRSVAITAGGSDERNRARGHQRLHRVGAPAESSGRGVRLSNQPGPMAISCMRPITSLGMPTSTSRSRTFLEVPARSFSIRTSRPKKCLCIRAGDTVTGRSARGLPPSCGAKQLWLFHHKPGRPDDEMRDIQRAAQQLFTNTSAASEGDRF